MSRPQQAHEKGLDNMPTGEIHYDGALATGNYQRLRYRTIAGVKRPMVTGPESIVWPAYLAAVADLAKDVRKMQRGILALASDSLGVQKDLPGEAQGELL